MGKFDIRRDAEQASEYLPADQPSVIRRPTGSDPQPVKVACEVIVEVDVFKPGSPVLIEPATERLYQAYLTGQGKIGPESTVDELFTAFQPLIEPINTFFDEVLVMAEDKALRENRLALLQHIAGLTEGIVDLTRVEGF